MMSETMETDDLPSIDPSIDYRKILPIQQKRTIAFINHFVMNTVSFLNHFAQSCESRLMDFEYRMQKLDAKLLVLESQLSSIAGLDVEETDNQQKVDEQNNIIITPTPKKEEDNSPVSTNPRDDDVPDNNNTSKTQESMPSENEDMKIPTAINDPRFSKYFKMMQFGVPANAVKIKMHTEGVDPNILDKPNEVIPGYICSKESESSDYSPSDSSDDSD